MSAAPPLTHDIGEYARLLEEYRALVGRLAGAAPVQPLTYTIGESATVLRCHRATVNRYIQAGELPAVRLGSRVLIRRSDLEALLERLTKTGVPEAAAARGRRVRAAREMKRQK